MRSREKQRARHHEVIAAVRAGTVGIRVPYPIRIRRTLVLRAVSLSASLIRVTLLDSGPDEFEAHAPDEHVKLFFPEPDGTLRLPEPDGDRLSWPTPLPLSRDYTVRRYDRDTGELDIDVALHGSGLGSDWAQAVQPGDPMHVAGPPGGYIVPPVYDRYLLAGDLTAVPAIARWLAELPGDARGWALIEVTGEADRIALSGPAGVEVRWLYGDGTPVLENAVRAVPLPPGERVYVWIAGEAGALTSLRRWAREHPGIETGDHHITGYWKRGTTDVDDEHHDH